MLVQTCGSHIRHISDIVKNADEIASKATHIASTMPTSLQHINTITAMFHPESLTSMFYRIMFAIVVAVAAIIIMW